MTVDDKRQRDLGQLADLVTHELTPGEAIVVRDRLEHDEAFRHLAAPVLAAWTVDRVQPLKTGEEARATLLIRMAEIDRQQADGSGADALRRRRRWIAGPLVGLAAVALLYVALASVPIGRQLMVRALGVPADFDVRTAIGEERSMRLPDGSRVTIEPDSRLSYRASFFEAEELFTLEGAATFDVVPQHFRQFRVAAGRVFAQVEGTRFTVRAYPGDRQATVSVLRGRVKVAGMDFRDVNVDSGFAAVVIGQTARVHALLEEGTISWDGQQLHFAGVPLETVLATLRHWYGQEIKLADHDWATSTVTATIPGTHDAGLQALCAAIGARAQLEGGAVVLYHSH